MSDSSSIGAYAASMSQSLYDQGKMVGRMIEAGQNALDQAKQKVTDNALQAVQKSTQAQNDIMTTGMKISVYA